MERYTSDIQMRGNMKNLKDGKLAIVIQCYIKKNQNTHAKFLCR